MKYNWLYLSLVVALIALVLAVWETPPKLLIPFSEPTQRDKLFPYAVIEEAQSSHFDPDGHLSYEFVAATLRHFRLDLAQVSDGDFTGLETPRLTLHTRETPWYATADLGELSEGGTLLTLWPNVRIWQEEAAGQITELTTTRLEIRPRDKFISSDEEVVITSPQGRIEAQGIKVDLANKRIHLLNQVRGYHEPVSDKTAP
jgi:lipopolysaccharide export system protein LptC